LIPLKKGAQDREEQAMKQAAVKNPVLDAIYSRRSVRHFTQEPVDPEIID
jgi:NRPS condensation-like uncharacterized protein